MNRTMPSRRPRRSRTTDEETDYVEVQHWGGDRPRSRKRPESHNEGRHQ